MRGAILSCFSASVTHSLPNASQAATSTGFGPSIVHIAISAPVSEAARCRSGTLGHLQDGPRQVDGGELGLAGGERCDRPARRRRGPGAAGPLGAGAGGEMRHARALRGAAGHDGSILAEGRSSAGRRVRLAHAPKPAACKRLFRQQSSRRCPLPGTMRRDAGNSRLIQAVSLNAGRVAFEVRRCLSKRAILAIWSVLLLVIGALIPASCWRADAAARAAAAAARSLGLRPRRPGDRPRAGPDGVAPGAQVRAPLGVIRSASARRRGRWPHGSAEERTSGIARPSHARAACSADIPEARPRSSPRRRIPSCPSRR